MSEETKQEQVGEEEVKDNEQDSTGPKSNGGNTGKDKETGQFIQGNTLGGRTKGTISIISRIKKYLKENPKKMDELVEYYLNDEKMRDLLFRMVDGNPRQRIGVGGLDEEGELTSVLVRVIRTPEDLKKLNEETTNSNQSL